MNKDMTPWQRFVNLLKLDKRDLRQIFYYAIFSGLVALTLPLGIQAIVNLIPVSYTHLTLPTICSV